MNPGQQDWQLRLGEWMRRERVRADLTRKQVAARVGVGLNAIERWEAGARRPLVDSFVRWCEAVGVPVELGIRQLALFINMLPTALDNSR